MGTTDSRFNSYKTLLLRRLEDAIKHGEEKEVVKQLVSDLQNELRKP